jgi:hypothetical protein
MIPQSPIVIITENFLKQVLGERLYTEAVRAIEEEKKDKKKAI